MAEAMKSSEVLEKIGKVTIEKYRGTTIRVRWYSRAKGRAEYITIGEDSASTLRAARKVAEDIDHAIKSNRLDDYLIGYKSQGVEASRIRIVSDDELIPKPQIDLLDLWDQWVEHKKRSVNEKGGKGLKANTQREYETHRRILVKLDKDLCWEPVRFTTKLIDVTTQDQARRIIMYLSSACEWGISLQLCSDNPFKLMKAHFKRAKPKDNDKGANSFTQDEKDQVIQAFRTNRYYSHYTNLVRFWFMTGCRPSEGLSLHWGDVSPDCSKVTFRGSYQEVKGAMVWGEGSKNNETRTIPVEKDCQELLKEIRPEDPKDDDLVFPSPTGKVIRYHNAITPDGWWHKVVDPIKPGTTPYNCRDTFITDKLSNGKSITLLAKYCDTSEQMIRENYQDDSKLSLMLLMD
ncbi:MAG: tyrosine-type recombinase/integrase [Synechococcaceae cyanobacterium SM2_3_2]|nr:tyrosine-type recombinase/integrase [Synechococcaceae cyanobacterium SM2_3_2]